MAAALTVSKLDTLCRSVECPNSVQICKQPASHCLSEDTFLTFLQAPTDTTYTRKREKLLDLEPCKRVENGASQQFHIYAPITAFTDTVNITLKGIRF